MPVSEIESAEVVVSSLAVPAARWRPEPPSRATRSRFERRPMRRRARSRRWGLGESGMRTVVAAQVRPWMSSTQASNSKGHRVT
jgi:hypothetical protein